MNIGRCMWLRLRITINLILHKAVLDSLRSLQ